MSFRVVETGDDTIEIWDGKSRTDPSHPGMGIAGMTITVGPNHGFNKGDQVDLIVRHTQETDNADD